MKKGLFKFTLFIMAFMFVTSIMVTSNVNAVPTADQTYTAGETNEGWTETNTVLYYAGGDYIKSPVYENLADSVDVSINAAAHEGTAGTLEVYALYGTSVVKSVTVNVTATATDYDNTIAKGTNYLFNQIKVKVTAGVVDVNTITVTYTATAIESTNLINLTYKTNDGTQTYEDACPQIWPKDTAIGDITCTIYDIDCKGWAATTAQTAATVTATSTFTEDKVLYAAGYSLVINNKNMNEAVDAFTTGATNFLDTMFNITAGEGGYEVRSRTKTWTNLDGTTVKFALAAPASTAGNTADNISFTAPFDGVMYIYYYNSDSSNYINIYTNGSGIAYPLSGTGVNYFTFACEAGESYSFVTTIAISYLGLNYTVATTAYQVTADAIRFVAKTNMAFDSIQAIGFKLTNSSSVSEAIPCTTVYDSLTAFTGDAVAASTGYLYYALAVTGMPVSTKVIGQAYVKINGVNIYGTAILGTTLSE